nr:ABC transporter permease [Halomicroarcula sp. SYNS111]
MARTAVDVGAAREQVTLKQISQYGPIIGLVGLYVAFTLLNDRFLTVGNQVNVLQQVSIIGIMAIGVTFPILCAEIDLSIAQVMEVGGLTIATLAVGARLFEGFAIPVPAAILVGLLLGATFGAVSGFVTARFGVPSFMTTLAMLFLADGFGLIVSGNRPIIGLPASLTAIGGSRVLGFPSIVIVFLALLVASQLLLSYTKFGLYIYAIGGDRQAAERMGINVPLVRLGTLIISGLFAGIAGLVTLGRLGSAVPTMGGTPVAAHRRRHPRRGQPVRGLRQHGRHARWRAHPRHPPERPEPDGRRPVGPAGRPGHRPDAGRPRERRRPGLIPDN